MINLNSYVIALQKLYYSQQIILKLIVIRSLKIGFVEYVRLFCTKNKVLYKRIFIFCTVLFGCNEMLFYI